MASAYAMTGLGGHGLLRRWFVWAIFALALAEDGEASRRADFSPPWSTKVDPTEFMNS